MPFSNPIVAGEELIRTSIKSPGFTTGVTGWRIAADGSAEFNNLISRGYVGGPQGNFDAVSANVSLRYQGVELQTILDAATNRISALEAALTTNPPVQVIARGYLPNNGIGYSAGLGVNVGIGYIGANLTAGKTYRIITSPFWFNANAVNTSVRLGVSFTTDGTIPAATLAAVGSTLSLGWIEAAIPQFYISLPFDYTFTVSNTAQWNFLFFLDNTSGGNRPSTAVIKTFNGTFVTVEDLGPNLPNTLYSSFTPPPPPPPTKTRYTINQFATATTAYKESGAIMNNNLEMYQGTDPSGYNGNEASDSFFRGTGPNTLSYMRATGANDGSIEVLSLGGLWRHWYYNSGGTMRLGFVDSVTGYHFLGDYNFGGAPYGYNINLIGTLAQSSILAGNFVGFTYGYSHSSPAGNLNFYGYQDGAGQTNPPIFHAQWYI